MFALPPVIQCAKTLIYYSFLVSFKTGQLIVTALLTSALYLWTVLKNIWTLVTIIYESFTIFLHDIVNGCHQIIELILHAGELIISTFGAVFSSFGSGLEAIVSSIISLYNFFINMILNVVWSIGQTFILCKRLLILFGSGVWFALTLIPVFLVYLCTIWTYFLGTLLNEMTTLFHKTLAGIKANFLRTIEFITDVPIESLVGIVAALCIAYVIMQFYLIIFSYLRQKMLATYLGAKQILQLLMRKTRETIQPRRSSFTQRPPPALVPIVAPHFPNGRPSTRTRTILTYQAGPHGLTVLSRPQIRPKTIQSPPPPFSGDADDRLCLICEENVKCVLVLPCKHVCMCTECSSRLSHYSNTCPVCRQDIEYTMKIFI